MAGSPSIVDAPPTSPRNLAPQHPCSDLCRQSCAAAPFGLRIADVPRLASLRHDDSILDRRELDAALPGLPEYPIDLRFNPTDQLLGRRISGQRIRNNHRFGPIPIK